MWHSGSSHSHRSKNGRAKSMIADQLTMAWLAPEMRHLSVSYLEGGHKLGNYLTIVLVPTCWFHRQSFYGILLPWFVHRSTKLDRWMDTPILDDIHICSHRDRSLCRGVLHTTREETSQWKH
jgi:hypothetical protein